MNWAAALTVVAIGLMLATVISAIATLTLLFLTFAGEVEIKLPILLFIITVITGALAAGLGVR